MNGSPWKGGAMFRLVLIIPCNIFKQQVVGGEGRFAIIPGCHGMSQRLCVESVWGMYAERSVLIDSNPHSLTRTFENCIFSVVTSDESSSESGHFLRLNPLSLICSSPESWQSRWISWFLDCEDVTPWVGGMFHSSATPLEHFSDNLIWGTSFRAIISRLAKGSCCFHKFPPSPHSTIKTGELDDAAQCTGYIRRSKQHLIVVPTTMVQWKIRNSKSL